MDIEITINGKKIITQTGLTILEAASRAGIKIPVLCYLKRLRPIGSCRICSVEVAGIEHTVPSCVAKVKEGYEISTDTERVWDIRREALSSLLLDHPLDCPVCDKSGDCDLQNLSFEFGLTKQNNKRLYPDRTNIFKSGHIEYMATRCVLCSRCIRVCSDMYGNPFYEIKGSGYDGYIGLRHKDETTRGVTSEGSSFKENKAGDDVLKCYYCGNCIEVCPVGALISIPSKFKERYWQESPFSSVCDKCSAACRTEYYRYEHEESLIRTASLFGGYLCRAGFFYDGIGKNNGYYIASPYIKKKSSAVESGIENAVGEFVARIKNISANGGLPDTAILVSPNVSTNEGYAISGFAGNVLKPAYFDIAASGYYRTNMLRFKTLFEGEETFDIKTVLNSEAMLYAGDIEGEIPYVAYNIMKTHREHGGKLFLVNTGGKERPDYLRRFEDIAFARQDVGAASMGEFFDSLKSGVHNSGLKNSGVMAENLLNADTISILLGDKLFSSCDMSADLQILKEITNFLRGGQKTVYVYPLIKPFNYRGLVGAGINPAPGSDFNKILSGLNSGKIKNILYIGDVLNDEVSREIVKHASGLEFLAVFSSKTSILSAMADVVIPIKDFLEGRNAFYENFEGKTISVDNEFNLGGYRTGIIPLLMDISGRLGHSFDYINREISEFTGSLKAKSPVYYNKSKARSNFYYNDKTKVYY